MTVDGQDQSLHQNKCHHRVQRPKITLKQIIQEGNRFLWFRAQSLCANI